MDDSGPLAARRRPLDYDAPVVLDNDMLVSLVWAMRRGGVWCRHQLKETRRVAGFLCVHRVHEPVQRLIDAVPVPILPVARLPGKSVGGSRS